MDTIGGFIGSLFGGGGGQQAVQTVQNTAEPWSGLRPSLESVYSRAEEMYNTPREQYGGQRVTDFAPDTLDAMNRARAQAQAPNGLYDAAASGVRGALERGGYSQRFDEFASPLINVANGGMLGSNPYLDQVVGQISDDASGAVNRNAFFKGRESSPHHAGAVADAIARTTAPIRMNDYASERGYMDQATKTLMNADAGAQSTMGQFSQLAPGIDAFGFADTDRLLQLGGMQEGKDAERIAEEIAKFDFGQNEPRNRLAEYAATVGGAPVFGGSTSQTFAPAPQISGSQILGGGLAGAQLGGLLGSEPIFGGISNQLLGAGIGGLLGAF